MRVRNPPLPPPPLPPRFFFPLSAAGVAFAPHRAVDVSALGADFYAVSAYKLFGPHAAALFATHDAWARMGEGPNFFFVPREQSAYKFELGGVSHEARVGEGGWKWVGVGRGG